MPKVTHVNNVANVGASLVWGLKNAGVDVGLFDLHKRPVKGILKSLWWSQLPFIRLIDFVNLRRAKSIRESQLLHMHYAVHSYLLIGIKKPFYIHVHGTDVRNLPKSRVLTESVKYGLANAMRVFYTTPDLYQYLEKLRSDAIFLPNPVVPFFFQQKNNVTREMHEIDILCINKIDEFKGIELCLKAIEDVWETNPNLKVAIFNFGNAEYLAKSFLRTHAKDERLIILNKVPHEKMPSLISSAKVVLGQLESGVLGNSELESMACGIPIVCRFDYPEAYDEPPPLLNARDHKEAASSIVSLLENESLGRSIGSRSRYWVAKNHGISVVVQNLLQYYQKDFPN